jgi:hypothetical protein
MKSPSLAGQRSSLFEMLASALSITSRLMPHNWHRTRPRSERSNIADPGPYKSPRGRAAASGDPIILLALLVLLGMLANRQMPSLSSASCRGMHSAIEQHLPTNYQSCYVAFESKLTSIKTILQGKMGTPQNDIGNDDFYDGDDLF